jgi:excinuclease ABC subunit C
MKTFPLVHLLEIDPTLKFPKIDTVRRVHRDRWTFGPFRSKSELERLKVDMERAFRLRPCDYDIQGNDPYPDCIYFQMNTCSKPCNGDIGRVEYMADVKGAARFIEGREHVDLEMLDRRIRELSDDLRFEEASELKKRMVRIDEARRTNRQFPYRVDQFHAIVVMDSGSTRTRRVAHVRNGAVVGFEDHDTDDIDRTLPDRISALAAGSSPPLPDDRVYEDFCLVARFMTRAVASVHVVPYTDDDVRVALEAVIAVIGLAERTKASKRSRASSESGEGDEFRASGNR